MVVKCESPAQWSRGDAPGEYGGPPVDPRIRTSWGTNRPDPITSNETYIWNTDWKKALELSELEAKEFGAGQEEKTKEKDSGFLSIGRSLALDSMDVDLSAELSKPSKATLNRQVAAARQVSLDASEFRKREADKEKIRWRFAPTTAEEKKWAQAKKYATGGSGAVLSDAKKELAAMDPGQRRELELQQFQQMKTDLQLYTVGIGAACLVSVYLTYDSEVALSYGAGLLGAVAYIRMLTSSVEALGASGMASAAKGALGQPRLLIPVVLVMLFNRWNAILVPQYDVVPLELIPMLVGFFTYKAATLVQTFREVFAPYSPGAEEA